MNPETNTAVAQTILNNLTQEAYKALLDQDPVRHTAIAQGLGPLVERTVLRMDPSDPALAGAALGVFDTVEDALSSIQSNYGVDRNVAITAIWVAKVVNAVRADVAK